MASLVTTQMLKLSNTKVLHLEPTDVCQASCPLCARETELSFDKSQHNHLTVETIHQLVGEKTVKNLDKMFMCGDYGDPAAGKHTLDIFKYFRSVNTNITLGMNSNGAIQNASWWQTLGDMFNKQNDYVVFSIDGLKDTNHIYRRGVVWDKLIENAQAYIATGASAHWDMLVYEHNQHQVDACEHLARDLGFTWFRAKVSKRVSNVDWLNPPKGWNDPVVSTGRIECFVEKEQSVYITAKGSLRPCCWHGYADGVELSGFNSLKESWDTDACNKICKETCTKTENKTSFMSQWQRNTALC